MRRLHRIAFDGDPTRDLGQTTGRRRALLVREVSQMPAERHRVAAFCPLCVSRCGCEAVVENGRLVAIEPDPSHPTGSCARRGEPHQNSSRQVTACSIQCGERIRKVIPIQDGSVSPGTRRSPRPQRRCAASLRRAGRKQWPSPLRRLPEPLFQTPAHGSIG